MLKLETATAFGTKYKIFYSPIRAWAHICDHILSRPEGFEWCALNPDLRDRFVGRNLFELARRIWRAPEENDPEAAELYRFYAKEIQRALTAAEKYSWRFPDVFSFTEDNFVIGLSGVLVITSTKKEYVKTAFIPSNDDEYVHFEDESALSDEEVARQRKNKPIPRDNGSQTDEDETLLDDDRTFRNFLETVSHMRTLLLPVYIDGDDGLDEIPYTIDDWRECMSACGF